MATRKSSRVVTNTAKKEKEERFNTQVRDGTPHGLVEIDAGIMGRGVATLKKYEEGAVVCHYEGDLIGHKEAI